MASMDLPADRLVTVPAVKATVVKRTHITWVTLAFQAKIDDLKYDDTLKH